MSPKEFMDKWTVNRKQLAGLLDLSLPQVERWFFDPASSNYQPIPEKHLKRLSELDFLFEVIEASQRNLDICPEHLQQFFKR